MIAVLESKKEEVVTLCQRYHVDRLELFGSAATERYDPLHSDLDFLVQFRAATPEEHADRYFGLLADLQDLFGCSIDLVEIPAIVNPYFLEGIEASRALIYAD